MRPKPIEAQGPRWVRPAPGSIMARHIEGQQFPFAVVSLHPGTRTPLFATAGEAWRHARLHGGRVVYLDRATPRCVPVATP